MPGYANTLPITQGGFLLALGLWVEAPGCWGERRLPGAQSPVNGMRNHAKDVWQNKLNHSGLGSEVPSPAQACVLPLYLDLVKSAAQQSRHLKHPKSDGLGSTCLFFFFFLEHF